MPNFVGKLISGTYLAIHNIAVTFGCVLAYMCKNVRPVCLNSLLGKFCKVAVIFDH